MNNYIYGWRPQRPDFRDRVFTPTTQAHVLPSKVDLRPECPPIVDQGQLGSCVSNATAGAHEFTQMKEKQIKFAPSRLFIYYNCRAMEGTIKQDAGADIRDGFKSISQQGVCDEAIWPYNIAKFKNKPLVRCYKAALKHKAVQYLAVTPTLDQVKGCLADGFPFVFGISVYASFESDAVAKTGVVPMPATNEQNLGGHAIMAVGYDDSTQRFTIRNSWGTSWGDQGYFYLPYEYVTNANLASDFWTVRVVA